MIQNNNKLKEEFEKISNYYAGDDKLRDEMINITREITKLSKMSIYSSQRNDFDEAEKLILSAEEKIKCALNILNKAELDLINNLKSGLEEYIEAKMFYNYLKLNKFITMDEMNISVLPYETYLCALCDFTGELGKKVVSLAIENNIDEIYNIKKFIDDVYGHFIKFDFRSSELRKKFEGLKYTINKIESVVYDLKIKK